MDVAHDMISLNQMFNFLKKKIIVVTHDGSFHADEVFASATLSLWAEKNNKKLKIIRTRDPLILEKTDIVVDVGMVYDFKNNKFDHHQKEGAGEHNNGIPYASFGLIWQKYGEEVCGSLEVMKIIEEKLVIPVDARDNGVNITLSNQFGVFEHNTTKMICNFNPTWQEDNKKIDEKFKKALKFAKEIIKREMAWARALIEGEKGVSEEIEKQNNPEILILDREIEWKEAVSKNKNIKFVIYYKKYDLEWCIQSARDNLKEYGTDRALFPESWRGLRDEELREVSGIKEAVFCHRAGFFAVLKSKEGALSMAKKALQDYD